MNSELLAEYCWDISQLGKAITTLASKTGLRPSQRADSGANRPPEGADIEAFVEWHAKSIGCEAQPIDAIQRNLEAELRTAYPAIIRIAPSKFLAVTKARGQKLSVLSADEKVRTVSRDTVCSLLREPLERQLRDQYSAVLREADIPARKQARSVSLLLLEQFGDRRFRDGWILRMPVGASFRKFLHDANAFRNGSALVFTHLLQYLAWLASWAILGRLSLQGRMDRGWLLAWALLLLTIAPLRVLATWIQGVFAVNVGMVLKRRLLLGTLRTEPEEVRHYGVGAFLGQTFEADAVESLALSGGIVGVLAVVEIIISGFVLGQIALLLVLWTLLTGLAGWRFLRHYRDWTGSRMEMTQELVESMVGNRTRLAQQPREAWHQREDNALCDYLGRSRQIDWSGAWLIAALPRGWLVIGLICLAPAAVSGTSTMADIAVRLGGVLLAFNAFKKLTASSVDIAAAVVAGMRIVPLFQSASRPEAISRTFPSDTESAPNQIVAEVDKVSFRYRRDGAPMLQPSSLTIKKGDRILLEGPSGGGKSTFVSLLSGMRKPDSGLVLINGLDSHTVGSERWSKQVSSSPQFHDNHILTETLAFNLLMGRRWPPTQADLEESHAICLELGLGNLLERMPGGMMQMVGEGGWQLSHGERSRVFIARSLLQNADLVMLDESFAALDPENLQSALQCTLDRAKTLLVIAHP